MSATPSYVTFTAKISSGRDYAAKSDYNIAKLPKKVRLPSGEIILLR